MKDTSYKNRKEIVQITTFQFVLLPMCKALCHTKSAILFGNGVSFNVSVSWLDITAQLLYDKMRISKGETSLKKSRRTKVQLQR